MESKRSRFLLNHLHWLVCALSILVVSFYWLVVASDRYVSHAHVVLESPQVAMPDLSFSSLLSGGGSNSSDMLLLRDYLLSVDMLQYLVKKADFREHYAHGGGDFYSKLEDENAPLEELHDYYLKRISVELDEYAGVLRIDVEAFTPKEANLIAHLLLSKGEEHMNEMGRRLAQEQVKFLTQQVDVLQKKFEDTRQALLDYQNEHGLVSPTGTVTTLSGVVSKLEGELASYKAQKKALSSYQSASSPEMVKVNSQISALEQQIKQEQQRLAAQSGNALNSVSAKYQRLELEAKFAQNSYSGALSALQSTQVEAARKLKQLSTLQSPTYPQYPEQPERVYNIVIFSVIAAFVALIVNMLILIVRDHVD